MSALRLFSFAALILLAGPARATELISAFEGSEFVSEYRADYDRAFLAQEGDPKPEILTVEGKLHSRLYGKPEGKSAREILLSYERELKAAGFDILLAMDKSKGKVDLLIRELYRAKGNAMLDRPYGGGGPANRSVERMITFGAGYLSARKATADATYHVMVVIGREDYMYAIETVESAALEANTVTLSPELLDEKLESEGRYAIYGITFATNSAEIDPASKSTLKVIADVLAKREQDSFYVVGHTDDTGALAHNVELSQRRAQSVATALTEDFGVEASRMEARGVGPLSPVGPNESAGGRDRNRRVEIVVRLK